MSRLAVLVLCGWLVMPATAGAAIRYVETTGSDASNSTCPQSKPCATVPHAVAVASKGDTIRIGQGQFTVVGGGVVVNKDVTIEGLGIFKTWLLGTAWDPGPVFRVESGADVTIRNMQILKGINGIVNNGSLVVEDVWIRQNRADGVVNLGVLSLRRVEVALNGGSGGLINKEGALLILLNSRVVANYGNGISNDHGFVLIRSSLFASNRWPVDDQSGAVAAGVLSRGGRVSLTNSTISGNQGWGLVMRGGEAVLTHVTVTDNPSGLGVQDGAVVQMVNSIVARNPVRDCLIENGSVSGVAVIAGLSCQGWLSGSLVGVDPLLAPLAPNDFPTVWSHALLPGSPAIDAAFDPLCESADQRGVARPKVGNGDGVALCDIGAYELAPTSSTRDGRGGGSDRYER